MTTTLVTSFTSAQYDKYAKDLIDTFRQYWPKDVTLVIYAEGMTGENEDNIVWRDIEEVEHYRDWMDAIGKFPVMSGQNPVSGYNINYDARHVRKALIEIYSCKEYGGKVWWIDADSITHQMVPSGWLDSVLPDDKFSAYCGRENPDGTPWMYTESGMLGFNTEHPMYQQFMDLYLQVFLSGIIFTQKGWHDCYGYDLARKAIDASEHFVNVSKDLPVGTMHPLVNSVFGTYLDHKKGPRKTSRSGKKDLVVERTEAYWNDTDMASPIRG